MDEKLLAQFMEALSKMKPLDHLRVFDDMRNFTKNRFSDEIDSLEKESATLKDYVSSNLNSAGVQSLKKY